MPCRLLSPCETTTEEEGLARRSFARSLLALACASLLATGVQAQEKVNLKMQATWPASLTLYENFTAQCPDQSALAYDENRVFRRVVVAIMRS